jgi:hypothetical protein
MKKISSTALTQVTTKLGGEPLCVVAIYWHGSGNPPSYYCDRGAHQGLPQLQGKIIKLANLDDVVNISNASNSQSVSITLDDTDGSIKSIYNNTDIHKKKVLIYQWFTQINFNDKFVIFEGIINSPIVWVEKDRTLSFEVVSKLEDAEIGFSPEEGDFPSINDNLIGKAWPMPFGTCLKVPAISIDLVGNATLMDSIGLHDPKLEADLQNLNLQKLYTESYAQALITSGSLLQTNSAGRGEGIGRFEENPDDPDFQQGAGMIQSGQKLLGETGKMDTDMQKIRAQITAQQKFEKTSVLLFNGTTFPVGVEATFEIGDLIVTGSISPVENNPRGDSILNITSVTTKKPFLTHLETGTGSVEKYYGSDLSGKVDFGFSSDFNSDLGLTSEVDITKAAPNKIVVDTGPGFVFVKAGTKIKWVSDLPQRWIAAMLPCTVLGVYAIRDYDGTKLMTAVPTNYYTVSYKNYSSRDGTGPGITATVITLKQPLSYINDVELTTAETGAGLVVTTESSVTGQHLQEIDKRGSFFSLINSTFSSGWEDQIYVDLISPVGPNTADILSYLITTYSGVPYPSTPPFACDPTTFNLVRSQLSAFPMHFCLFDRKNLFDVLKEIAFQARCAIWLKEDVFYLLYLVPEATPVDSITLNDIQEDSLELHHTGTEELVTKFVASYKIYYGPPTGFPASDIGQKDDKIILRANMAKYGLHEQAYNYYAYTNTILVDLSSTFWIIRKANTWKLVQFKTPLHKLKLETFDSVTIDLRSVSDEAVVGVVQSANLDTDAMEISFSVWVPVRLGEMFKYPGANPDVEFFYPYIHDDPGSQNIGETAGGNIHTADNPNAITISYEKRKRPHYGNQQPGVETLDPIVTPILDKTIGALDTTLPAKYPPVNRIYDLSTNPNPNTNISAIPARVKAPSDAGLPEYNLDSYPKGLGNPSVVARASDVTYDATNSAPLEPGTWVMIQPLMYRETKNERTVQTVKRYFLPAIGGTSTYPGIVTGGSGSTYTVNIYKKGLTGAPESVTVTQLQIHTGENIPAGTWALIAKGTKTVGGVSSVEYTMQVPVWL